MKKRRFSFAHCYLALILLITYLPIAVVIAYSFNKSDNGISCERHFEIMF